MGERQHPHHVPRGSLRLIDFRGHPLLLAGRARRHLPPGRAHAALPRLRPHLPHAPRLLRATALQAVIDTVEANGVAPCYIRPVAFRGYGEIGINPIASPVEVYIANYPWGKYVPGNEGANVCVSSWNRHAPNTMPTMSKAGGNYLNSQLIRMEAEVNGYDEGIALDVNGLISEGSGENLFLVRGGVLYTTPLSSSVLNGITRSSILTLAKELGIPVVEQSLPREMLYVSDEAFFTGTAAEVTHLRSVDRILVGDGTMGPVTTALHDEFFGIVQGTRPDRHGWLTPVHVKMEEPVAV